MSYDYHNSSQIAQLMHAVGMLRSDIERQKVHQKFEMERVQSELARSRLVIASLVEYMMQQGGFSLERFNQIVDDVDMRDGALDGKYEGRLGYGGVEAEMKELEEFVDPRVAKLVFPSKEEYMRQARAMQKESGAVKDPVMKEEVDPAATQKLESDLNFPEPPQIKLPLKDTEGSGDDVITAG